MAVARRTSHLAPRTSDHDQRRALPLLLVPLPRAARARRRRRRRDCAPGCNGTRRARRPSWATAGSPSSIATASRARAHREHSRRRRVGRRSGRAPSAPLRRLLHAQPDRPRLRRRCSSASLKELPDAARSASFPRCTATGWTTSAVERVFRAAAEHGAAVFVHCGVLTVGVRKKLGLPSRFDLRLGDPLALARMALGFPQVPVIVPHFGAGFFREALMAADQCPTIHFDTSSSNSWIRFDGGQTLEGVFQQRPRRRRRLASALRHRLVLLPARLAGRHLRRAAAHHELRSASASPIATRSSAATSIGSFPAVATPHGRRLITKARRHEGTKPSFFCFVSLCLRAVAVARLSAAIISGHAKEHCWPDSVCGCCQRASRPGARAARRDGAGAARRSRPHQRPHRHRGRRDGRRRRRSRSARTASRRSARRRRSRR